MLNLDNLRYLSYFEIWVFSGLTQNRTKVGVIHELPLRNNQGFSYFLRKS
jgi:hypothetical protein